MRETQLNSRCACQWSDIRNNQRLTGSLGGALSWTLEVPVLSHQRLGSPHLPRLCHQHLLNGSGLIQSAVYTRPRHLLPQGGPLRCTRKLLSAPPTSPGRHLDVNFEASGSPSLPLVGEQHAGRSPSAPELASDREQGPREPGWKIRSKDES